VGHLIPVDGNFFKYNIFINIYKHILRKITMKNEKKKWKIESIPNCNCIHCLIEILNIGILIFVPKWYDPIIRVFQMKKKELNSSRANSKYEIRWFYEFIFKES
jgi:hypothetical protein